MTPAEDQELEGVLARFFAAELPGDLPACPHEEPAERAAVPARDWRRPAYAVALSVACAAFGLWAFRPPLEAPAPEPSAPTPLLADVPADIVPPGYATPVARRVSFDDVDDAGQRRQYTMVSGRQPLGWRPVRTDAGWMAEGADLVWTEVTCMLPETGQRIRATVPALRLVRTPWPGVPARDFGQ